MYKKKINGSLVLIAVYVDDIIIGCTDKRIVLEVKMQIYSEFDVSDKGPLHHFLGLEIDRCGETGAVKFGQTKYINNMLEKYGMSECKRISTPLEVGYQPQCTDNCQKFDQQQYQSMIAALMYLDITTRPDILHSVSKLAQRNSDPHHEHLQAVKHILRYLAGIADYKLNYTTSGSCLLSGYVDADWGGDISDR